MQAQCWFMICPDCGECVESMDVHCDGKMRGQFPNPNYAMFEIGEPVKVNSPGHRQDGKVGTVSYQGKFMGTWGVAIDGNDYGLLPSEIIAISEQP